MNLVVSPDNGSVCFENERGTPADLRPVVPVGVPLRKGWKAQFEVRTAAEKLNVSPLLLAQIGAFLIAANVSGTSPDDEGRAGHARGFLGSAPKACSGAYDQDIAVSSKNLLYVTGSLALGKSILGMVAPADIDSIDELLRTVPQSAFYLVQAIPKT
eukprot:405046-Amphidinium_carterae.1